MSGLDPILHGKLNKHIKECESGGGLPVVELETAFGLEGKTALSESDCAKMDAIASNPSPVIFKFSLDGMFVCEAVATCASAEGRAIAYTANYGILLFAFACEDAWSVETMELAYPSTS